MTKKANPFAAATLLALLGCAAPSHLSLADGSLDGTYVGHRTIDPTCGTQSQTITFYVDGSAITTHRGRHHKGLEGTVSANGQIALRDGGRRLVEGQITGVNLTATEQDQPSTKKNYKAMAVYDPLGSACVWRYDAVRVAEAGAAP
jgi:hypothetical protein